MTGSYRARRQLARMTVSGTAMFSDTQTMWVALIQPINASLKSSAADINERSQKKRF